MALVVIIFSACTGEREVRRVLAKVDKIMEEHPDSALLFISKVDTVKALRSDEVKALYYLLLIQAQYKCNESTPQEDKLGFCLDYFKQSGDEEKMVRAYYYRAMTLYDRKKYDEAIPLLKEGVLLAEKLGDDELISKFYDTLGNINGNAGDYRQVIKYKKRFLACSVKMNNWNYIAWGNIDIGLAYHKLGQDDSSDFYYKKVIPILDKVKKDKAYILTNIGCMYLRHNDLQTAEKYLKKSLKLKMRINAVAALSDLYMREGRLEDAEKLRIRVMSSGDADLKITMMKSYAGILQASGDAERACEAYRWLFNITDSLRSQNKENVIAQLQMMYDYTKAESERQESERKSYMYLSFSLSLIIMALIVSACLYRRHEKKSKAREKKYEKTIADNERKISELQKKNEENIEDKHMRLGHGFEIYKELKSGRLVTIKSSYDRSCLVDFFSICEHKEYHRLVLEYGDLPAGLKVSAVLYSMGISDEDMKSVLGVSEQTVRANKSKLKKSKKCDIPKAPINQDNAD